MGAAKGISLLPIPYSPTTNHLQIYDYFHSAAGALNWRQASSAVADGDRIYDHLHGSRLHLACGDGYPQRIWLRCGDDGLDLQRVQFVVCALSDPGRLAGGSVRTAARANINRSLVVGLH